MDNLEKKKKNFCFSSGLVLRQLQPGVAQQDPASFFINLASGWMAGSTMCQINTSPRFVSACCFRQMTHSPQLKWWVKGPTGDLQGISTLNTHTVFMNSDGWVSFSTLNCENWILVLVKEPSAYEATKLTFGAIKNQGDCIVCGHRTVLTFVPGRLLHKQEIIFLSYTSRG